MQVASLIFKEKKMSRIHVIKRSDGRFEARVTVSKYKRKSVYGSTEAEARKKARELEKASIQCDLTNIKEISLEQYMLNWLNGKKHTIKQSSYDRILQSITYQIIPNLNYQLSSITTDDIEKMLNSLAQTVSYSTMKKAYNNLNSCLKSALIKGHTTKNPMDGVPLPKYVKQETKEIRVYTPDEIVKIVSEAKRKYSNGKYVYRYGYFYILLLNTGMRLGEGLYLRWNDIDMTKNRIHIVGNSSQHKNPDGKGYVITDTTTKTKSSVRYIPLNNNANDALNHLKETIGDNLRVVATKNHTPVSPHNIYRQFKAILKKCDIEANDIIHSLRHTFATTLISLNKYTLKEVSELLGHSDVNTTANIYQHTLQETKIAAVSELDNLY